MPTIKIEMSDEELAEFINGEDFKAALGNRRYTVVQDSRVKGDTAPRVTVFQMFDEQILIFRTHGSRRSAETYAATLRSLKRFRRGRDFTPAQVTPQLLEGYQCHLRERKLTMNTVSFYMRVFRAVYNRAVDRGLTPDVHPFRRVYTGIAKTVKRALPLTAVKAIKDMQLTAPRLLFARDMFMFSFYTRGMAFVDMAALRTGNLNNGVLTYKRQKTGQPMTIRWEPEMQEIVDRYKPAGDYLLPVIRKLNGKERNQYRQRQSAVNKGLGEIAALLGLDMPLTLYVARHSWASIAASLDVPLAVISRGMGHASEKTTGIYLRSIDMCAVDSANSKIIGLL